MAKAHITLDREVVYRVKQDDFALEVTGIHPQQLKWVQNVMDDYIKMQKWLQTVYNKQYKDTFGDHTD